MKLPRPQVPRQNPLAHPVLYQQRCGEILVVDANLRLDYLLEQDLQDDVSRRIPHESRPGLRRTRESSNVYPTFFVPIEYDPHVLQRHHVLRRALAHRLHRAPVRQVAARGDGVLGVGLPRVPRLQRGVYPAVRPRRMTPHRMHLGKHRHVRARRPRAERCPKSRESAADYYNVMLRQRPSSHSPLG